MKFQKFLILYCLCFIVSQVNAQGGFVLENNKKRDRFSFELVNNLVVIPVEVNGTPLSFLLDTGVDKTIIFSLSSNDSLELKNTKRVKIRGLGNEDAFEAIKSNGNTVNIGNAVDNNHTLYLVFDTSLNLSSRMGIPVHGIVGYEYFKNFVVKTNYTRKKIVVYNLDAYSKNVCRRCEVFPLSFRNNKPYVDINLNRNGIEREAHLLLDTGSSDAIWLFDNGLGTSEDPKKYFQDFLGLGLSGNIYGKRAQLQKLKWGSFEFKKVNVAYPADSSTVAARLYEKRDGTIGGEIMRRFTSVINYNKGTITLKKNNQYLDPFHYNMSGLTLEHSGSKILQTRKRKPGSEAYDNQGNQTSSTVRFNTLETIEFELVPKFKVVEVRKGSPAHLAGIIVGSEILEVNNKPAHRWSLSELVELFTSKPGKKINLVVVQDGFESKVSFRLKKVL